MKTNFDDPSLLYPPEPPLEPTEYCECNNEVDPSNEEGLCTECYTWYSAADQLLEIVVDATDSMSVLSRRIASDIGIRAYRSQNDRELNSIQTYLDDLNRDLSKLNKHFNKF